MIYIHVRERLLRKTVEQLYMMKEIVVRFSCFRGTENTAFGRHSQQKISCLLHKQMYSQVSSVPRGLEYDLLSSYIEVSDRPPLTVLAYTHWWKSHGFWVGQSPHQLLISSTE